MKYSFLLLSVSAIALLASSFCYAAEAQSTKAHALSEPQKREFNNYMARAIAAERNRETYPRALEYLEQALKVDPDSGGALLLKGEILMKSGEPQLAEPVLARACRLLPKKDEAWFDKAKNAYSLNKDAEALEAINHCLALKDSSPARRMRCKLYYRAGKVAQAEREAALLVQREPKNGMNRGDHAEYAAALGMWDKVAADMEEATTNTSAKLSNGHHLLFLAQAYEHLHKQDKAIAALKKALALFPDSRELHVELLRIYKESGNKVAAAQEAKALHEIESDFGILKP